MADRDTSLYDLLGVLPNDDWEAIHAAYRIARSKHHPDRGGDEELFKQIQDAYNFLSDRSRRKAYDAGEIGPDSKPHFKTEEEELQSIARQGLTQMLSQLLEIDKPIFPTLLEAIAKHDSDANLLILKLRRNRNKLEMRLKNSIKFKGGSEDLLSVIAKGKISAWEKQIEGTQRSLKIFAEGKKMALAMQKQYEETPEPGLDGMRVFQLDENFDPAKLEDMMRQVFGEQDSTPDETTIRKGPKYQSPYGPQSGRKR